MILDTSAVIALLFEEPEADGFYRLIQDADICRMSVANYLEVTMVLERLAGTDANRRCELFFHRAGIVLEPVTLEQGYLARQAFFEFGKGRHSAGLNFGDCFAYALSKVCREPLLFKGEDFRKTDLELASSVQM